MKSRNFIAIVLLISVFLGCKNDKSVDALEVIKPEIVDTFFKVSVEFIANQDDDFSLFYTDDGSTNFLIPPIWKGVKGQSDIQRIDYYLPEEVFPSQLRLDFGLNKNQGDIILKNVILEYMGNKKEISGSELGLYFRPDTSKCSFDAASGVIKAVYVDGVRQYPSLYPIENVLGPEILKIAGIN